MTYRIVLDKEEATILREAATFSVSDGALFIWKDLNFRDPISSWSPGNWLSIEPDEIVRTTKPTSTLGYPKD